MSVLFCSSPQLCILERQMQPPPGYREAAEKHTVFQVYFYNTQKIHQFRECNIKCVSYR